MAPYPMLNADTERKKVQLAAIIMEIEEKKQACRVELDFDQNGHLVSGHKYLPILK